MTTQIRLRDLLREDPYYRKWFMKIPNVNAGGVANPWRLYIQKEEGGRWAKADLRSYAKAYDALRLRLPQCWDATVHSKVHFFAPPILRVSGKKYRMPMPEGHLWCSLCRRPTVFKFFKKHPSLKYCNSGDLRCLICGAREAGMPRYKSSLIWPVRSVKPLL